LNAGAVEHAEIENPVEGWNPLPGDPDVLVWFDGARFTSRAVRVDDGWELAPVDEPPVVASQPGAGSEASSLGPPAPPPAAPGGVVPPAPPGGVVRPSVPRWVAIALIVCLLVAVGGSTFAAGWASRGPGPGRRASKAVPTSCSSAEILGVVQDWSVARDRFHEAEEGSDEEELADKEFTAQEDRLERTLVRCEARTATPSESSQDSTAGPALRDGRGSP